MNGFIVQTKKLWKLSVPIILGQLLWFSMNVVDTLMVGRISNDALAALGVAGAVYGIFYVAIVGVYAPLGPLIAQLIARGKLSRVKFYFYNGIWVAAISAVLFAVVFWFVTPLLAFFGQDPSLFADVESYLRVIAFGLPGHFVFMMFRQFAEGNEDASLTAIIGGIAGVANIPLNAVFIYGWWIFPPMGVAGAALTTASLGYVMCAVSLYYFWKKRRYQKFNLFEKILPLRRIFVRRILKLGIPSAAGILAEFVYFAAMTLIVGAISKTQLASHQIAVNIISLCFMVPLGLSIAAGVRFGTLLGKNDQEGLKSLYFAANFSVLMIQAVMGLVYYFGGEFMASLYVSDDSAVELAVVLLHTGIIFLMFDGLQCLGMISLRGVSDVTRPFLNAMFGYWVIGIPVMLILANYYGAVGVWIGASSGLAAAAYLHQIRLSKWCLKGERLAPQN